MLFIRRAQIEAFEAEAWRSFERRVSDHLHEIWPAECEELGPDGVLRRIRLGVERAGRYGIKTQRGIVELLHLMFCFGDELDTDPRLPWVRDILLDPRLDAEAKLEELDRYAESLLYPENRE